MDACVHADLDAWPGPWMNLGSDTARLKGVRGPHTDHLGSDSKGAGSQQSSGERHLTLIGHLESTELSEHGTQPTRLLPGHTARTGGLEASLTPRLLVWCVPHPP